MKNINLELSDKEKKVLNILLTLDMDRIGMRENEQKIITKIYNKLNGIKDNKIEISPSPKTIQVFRGSDIFH